MEVITIEKQAYKRLIGEISALKMLIVEMSKKLSDQATVQIPASKENWISIKHACTKYNTSRVTINAKRKMFEQIHGRAMKRCHGGRHARLFDETELVMALQLKTNDIRLTKLRNRGQNI